MFRALIIVAGLFCLGLSGGSAVAAECSISADDLNFANVDTLLAGANTSTSLTITCSEIAGDTVAMCVGIDAGLYPNRGAQRAFMNGSSELLFQLSASPGGGLAWGPIGNSDLGSPHLVRLSSQAGTATQTVSAYGAISSGQQLSSTGNYSTQVLITGAFVEGDNLDCTNTAGGTITTTQMAIKATVPANCLIQAQDISFGTVGIIDQDLSAPGGLDITCTPGAAYTITMGVGNNFDGTTRRMSAGNGAYVSYGLFRDQGGNLSWDTPLSETATGSDNQPVYGRVPVQPAAPGNYSDTVTVTIEYGDSSAAGQRRK